MQPFNYTMQVANPVTSALQTATMANQFKAGQQQTEMGAISLENARAAQAQAATARARAAEVSKALAGLGQSPDPKSIVALMAQYPEVSEKLDPLLKWSTEERRGNETLRAQQVYSAVLSGDIDIAEDLLTQDITAYKESGMALDARAAESRLQMLRRNPKAAAAGIGMFLARSMGPEKFAEAFDKIEGNRREGELQPSKVAESEAKATSAAVAAKYAESNAAQELAKKGWEIDKLKNDIQLSRLNQQVASAQAALQRQMAPLQVQEAQLKLRDLNEARDKRTREVESEAMGKFTVLNEAESLVTDILSDENRDALKGSLGLTAFAGAIPGTPERTIAGKIERLGSLMTIENVKLLSGILSDSDMKLLRQIGANFDRYQNQDAAIAELTRAKRAISDGRGSLVKKYGKIPQTPVPATTQTDW